jgi:hypothetical protein
MTFDEHGALGRWRWVTVVATREAHLAPPSTRGVPAHLVPPHPLLATSRRIP